MSDAKPEAAPKNTKQPKKEKQSKGKVMLPDGTEVIAPPTNKQDTYASGQTEQPPLQSPLPLVQAVAVFLSKGSEVPPWESEGKTWGAMIDELNRSYMNQQPELKPIPSAGGIPEGKILVDKRAIYEIMSALGKGYTHGLTLAPAIGRFGKALGATNRDEEMKIWNEALEYLKGK